MKGFLKEWGPSVLDGLLLLLSFSLDHYDVLAGFLLGWYPVVQPVLFIVLGAFGGWSVTSTIYKRGLNDAKGSHDQELSDMRDEYVKQLADKDAEIARITEDKITLQRQLASANSEWKSKVAAREFDIASLKMELAKIKAPDQEKAEMEQVRTPSGKLCCNMTAVRQLPTETVEAMLDAFDHGGGMEFGPHERAVRKSIEKKEGVFRILPVMFMGMPTGEKTNTFMLCEEWYSFMDDAAVLAEMRQIVRSAGPVWHEI